MSPATARLGELETLVMLAVLHLGEGAHAVAVRAHIGERTGRELSRGTVYVTLDRLEHKGLLVSRLGEPTAERGGKAKRLYHLEKPGLAALTESLSGTQSMLNGLASRLRLPR